MIKSFTLITSILFSTLICQAQGSNFGIFNYVVPTGYQLIKNDKVLTYYKEEKSTGAYCNIFIYGLMPGKGGVQQDFDFSWVNLMQQPFKVTGTLTRQPVAALKGWQFLMGTTNYSDNGVATLAMLFTFSDNKSMQSICILSNSDLYKKDIEQFIASVDVVAKETSTSVSTQSEVASSKLTTNIKKEEVTASSANLNYEVWMCHCYVPTGNVAEMQFKTVVLSPDGRSIYHMPGKGLNGVTPSNSNETGSWGKYTDKGDRLSLVNDQYGNMELYKMTPTSMSRYPNSKTAIYKKVNRVDGLRIEGAYSPELSYYNGKEDAITRQIDNQKRPILFFKKDGTFINEGLSFSNLTYGDDFAIGKGTYEIVNYSLILTMANGRKLQVAFTPLLDANPASTDNSGLMINNQVYYRLSKAFVPHN